MDTPGFELTTPALARKLNLAPQTVLSRAAALGIQPDNILLGGDGKAESFVWNLERLPTLRDLLGAKRETAL